MSNKTLSFPLLLAIVVAAVIFGISGWMRQPANGAAVHAGAGASAATSGGEGASSVGRTADLQAALQAVAATQGTAAPLPPNLLKANDAAVTAMAEAGERKLRARYEAERIDPRWAAAKQHTLEDRSVSKQILALDARPLAINASCRSTVCRIGADFASGTAANDWYTLYTLNAGGELFGASVRGTTHPDGTVHLDIYASARE